MAFWQRISVYEMKYFVPKLANISAGKEIVYNRVDTLAMFAGRAFHNTSHMKKFICRNEPVDDLVLECLQFR